MSTKHTLTKSKVLVGGLEKSVYVDGAGGRFVRKMVTRGAGRRFATYVPVAKGGS